MKNVVWRRIVSLFSSNATTIPDTGVGSINVIGNHKCLLKMPEKMSLPRPELTSLLLPRPTLLRHVKEDQSFTFKLLFDAILILLTMINKFCAQENTAMDVVELMEPGPEDENNTAANSR